ncbi:MAG: glutathione synthase, partial [Alcaligenes aquatilis]
MHVLFIIDPLPSLSAYKDSSVAMMRAFLARGHRVSVTLQSDLYISQSRV